MAPVLAPEVRQAWLTAGDWVVANWPNLAIAAVLSAFAWWSIRRASRRVDQILHTDPPAIDAKWGIDDGLLLDAALVYYGPAGLQRLLNDITQTRKEKP